ncbi:MAG: hypothetical protein EOP11_14550 [Proteobacteria bacterium]|nr:MAG: hypothetical protein EOP11_14550 [Pseudomonadota bacterium]
MMKLALALCVAAVFTASPARAEFAPVSEAPIQSFSNDGATESFVRPWRPGRPGRPGRRCFVRDRFRTYNNLNGCYRNSPAPRTCRQVCR